MSGCEVNGLQLRIPDAARPALGGDGHLAVIDQVSGWEYDFWQVRSKPLGGGTLTVSHGGRTRIDGDGLGSAATAAWFGLAAASSAARRCSLVSSIMRCSLRSSRTSGTTLYPAQPGTTGNDCQDFGLSNTDAPPMGARIYLEMSDAEIDALAVPPYRKVILRALAHYGFIVGDTNGGNAAWGLQVESGASYTSFGEADPFGAIAAGAGLQPFGGGKYAFDITTGVDWSRLRVLDTCVSQGNC